MSRIIYLTQEDAASMFPEREADSHKGTYGYVALVGGSIQYSGAIRLAAMANAAMRSGAGVATVAAPRSIGSIIANAILEPTFYPLSDREGNIVFNESEFSGLIGRYDTIAFGMGIGNSMETRDAVSYLLDNYAKTLIVDADGLNAMSELPVREIRATAARLVLTPHVKEFSRLSGMDVSEIKADPAEAAVNLSDKLGAVVLLKGSTTVVAAPGADHVIAIDRGCPGMATAGSGDVLSGILSAICVNKTDLQMAAAAGAYINGVAGELAAEKRSQVTMTAGDTASCVAEAIETITK